MFSGRGRGEDVGGRALPDLRLERVRAGEVVALAGIERAEHLGEGGRGVDFSVAACSGRAAAEPARATATTRSGGGEQEGDLADK